MYEIITEMISLIINQSYDSQSASEVTLRDMVNINYYWDFYGHSIHLRISLDK